MDALYSGPGQDAKRFIALVVGLMTLSVLLLSGAGISALMSFAAARRRREIGIRVALGAPRGRIVAAIFSRSARQLALGLVMGTAAAGALDRLAGGELLGGRAALLLPLVAAMMVLAGLLATLAPARRTLRIHPIEALKAR
jgi:putative ABC transport system permease protein